MQEIRATAAAATTTTTEASKMLEAALQQMDGIISSASAGGGTMNASQNGDSGGCGDGDTEADGVGGGGGGNGSSTSNSNNNNSSNTNGSAAYSSATEGSGHALGAPFPLSERTKISAANVLSTAKTLALALQQVGVAAPAPDPVTASIINEWLETHIPRQDADERLRRLQRDKESLALQYQMLADRVSEQSDKIIELEGLLTEKTAQLSAKDELLQRQMLSRSALETQKLELMSALSELKLHRAALERENVELRGIDELAPATDAGDARDAGDAADAGGLKTAAPYGSVGNLNQASYGPGMAPKTPPFSLRHQIQAQFHSLPRSRASKHGASRPPLGVNTVNNNNNNNNNNINNNNNGSSNSNCARSPDAAAKQRNVAFASNEKILIEDAPPAPGADLMYGSFMSQANSTPSPTLRERSAKGLRSMLGKLRRSNSGNLELPALEQAEPEFRRGGARATTGGRIEWSAASSATCHLTDPSKAYKDWTPQEICNWLCDLGLGCYEAECRRWLKANPSVCFFATSPVDIERELSLKMPLHRKKIVLAIDELTGKEDDGLALKAAQLDVSWVMRWLDDIGLPQYKDTFLQAKIDGRMLHRLTLEDLAQLHVSSCLHIASLRRGIQCMREMDWNPDCLIRRSTKSALPAGPGRGHNGTTTMDGGELGEAPGSSMDSADLEASENIALWTAHRVMEWLRVVDLSEYAPNLRGAGVHGALMLYEPLFNAELLADLLSISPSKTLLRRHLATHFKELLGRDVIQGKREAESKPGHQPLTITAKIKPPKKTQFSLKRRKSVKAASEIDWTDYVCPMMMMSSCLSDAQAHNNQSTITSTSTNNSGSISSN